MATNQAWGEGGYTCARCGAWVPNGWTHSCSGWMPAPPPAMKWDRMSDVRIADALERIAAALEELTKSVQSPSEPKAD